MPISYTYIAPLSKPTGLTVTRNAGGGSWIGNTYKFRVQTGNGALNYSNTFGLAASEVSDEFIIEVQDNDSLTFDFEPVDARANNFIIFFEKVGTNNGQWIWVNVGDGYSTISELPITVTAPRHTWYNYTYNPFHLYPYPCYGLQRDKGWFDLEITGDGDITVSDINNILRTEAPEYENILWFDYKDKGLVIMGKLNLDNYGVGTFILDDVIFVNALTIRTSANLKFYMNNAIWVSSNRGSYATDIINNFEIINSELLNDVNQKSGGVRFYPNGDNHIIKNSIIKNPLLYLVYDQYLGENNKIYVPITFRGTIENTEFQSSIAHKVNYNDSLLIGCTFGVDLPNGYIFLNQATDYTTEYRNCKFFSIVDDINLNISVGERLLLNDLFWKTYQIIFSYSYTNADFKIKFTNSVDLTLIDNNDNALENVYIEIINGNDGVVYSGYTNNVGEISAIVEMMRLQAKENGGGLYNEGAVDKLDFNPFTISISKDGYQGEQYSLNIEDPVKNTIVLKPNPTPVYYQQNLQGSIEASEMRGVIEETNITGSIE